MQQATDRSNDSKLEQFVENQIQGENIFYASMV